MGLCLSEVETYLFILHSDFTLKVPLVMSYLLREILFNSLLK